MATNYEKFLSDLSRAAEIQKLASGLADYRARTGKSLNDVAHMIDGFLMKTAPAPDAVTCRAVTQWADRPCSRRAISDGLCHQHGYIMREGKWDVRWPKAH